MAELSKIQTNTTWSDAANVINNNNDKINAELTSLKSSTTNFKGYFTDVSSLQSAYPNPKDGQSAWVGSPYPGTVYKANSGSWTNTSEVPSVPEVELNDYYDKMQVDSMMKLQDDNLKESIAELETEIYNLQQTLFGNNENLFTVTIDNGYIDGSGILVENPTYKSCQYIMTPGKYYYSIQLESAFIRIFVKENDNYKQVESFNSNDGYYIFYCPSDGKEYIFQKVVTSEKYGNIFQMSNTPKNLLMRLYELEISIPEYVQRISNCEKRVSNCEEKIGNMESNFNDKITDLETEIYNLQQTLFGNNENLFSVTLDGKYIDDSGNIVTNAQYKSCQYKMNPGKYYYTLQLESAFTRIFIKEGDTYTLVESFNANDGYYIFYCPNDGKEYIFQKSVSNVKYGNIYQMPSAPENLLIKFHRLKKELMTLEQDLTSMKNEITTPSLKLLAIGNSYSRDALSYVPKLLENIVPNINVVFGILYRGSCTLQQHYTLISTNGDYEEFDFYESSNGKWVTTASKNIDYALGVAEWDIITLQQQSSNSRDYSTYQPYLNDIIDLLLKKLTYTVKLGWLLTPSYPANYGGLSGDTSDEMFEKICAAVQSVMDNTAIEFFIPCGTAIQNARTTTLVDLGDFGGLSYEGLHLQEGIPCLIEAYVATLSLIDMIGHKNKGVYGNQIRPTQENVIAWNVPQRNGTVTGVNDENCYLAQKCAIMAIKKPLEITTIDF